MKTWIIVAAVVAILALGSVFAFNITGNTVSAETCEDTTCKIPGGCPNNGECTKQNNCGNPECGVQKTGSCGCGK